MGLMVLICRYAALTARGGFRCRLWVLVQLTYRPDAINFFILICAMLVFCKFESFWFSFNFFGNNNRNEEKEEESHLYLIFNETIFYNNFYLFFVIPIFLRPHLKVVLESLWLTNSVLRYLV